MASCVVVRRGVACNVGAPQFVDVPVAVDTHVIRDVDPSLLVLVVPLILAQSPWGITVFAEDHGLVGAGRPARPERLDIATAPTWWSSGGHRSWAAQPRSTR